MRLNKNKKNEHAKQMVNHMIALLCGLAIIGLGIFTFLAPERRAWLFPVIFLLAAAFQVINAIPGLTSGYGKENKKKKISGVLLCGFAALLVAIAVISAICLWR